jgi:tight adherence protein C
MLHDILLLRALAVLLFGSSLAIASYAVVVAPTRVASRLGMRGLKRRLAVARSAAWAQVEPLVRWLGVRVSALLSDRIRAALDHQILLAGDYLGLTPEEYVALSIVSGLGGVLFGATLGVVGRNAALFIVVCGALGAIAPYLCISGAAQQRLKHINRALPYVVELIALGMSAGLDFPGALNQVVQKSSEPDDPLVEELRRILHELRLGMTRRQALAEFARRAPTSSVAEFVGATVQAEERGNPIAEVLAIQATVSRQRRTVAAEEAAARAGVAMVGPLFMLFFCILILLVAPSIMRLTAGL